MLKDENNLEVKITDEDSSLAEFTKRPLPSEKQVQEFEEYIEDEAREGEIDESLNEIYQDEKGDLVDVRRLSVLKKHSFIYWILMVIIVFGGIAGISYFAYNKFFIQGGTDAKAVEFIIEGKSEVISGEEVLYTIYYKNLSNVALVDARIDMTYPENFIFLDSAPEANEKNSIWEIDYIPAQFSGKLKIKGMFVGKKDKTNLIHGNFRYTPENFSSEFKKSITLAAIIKDIGVDISFDFLKTALVNDVNEVNIYLSRKEKGNTNFFRVSMELDDNMKMIKYVSGDTEGEIVDYEEVRPGVWNIKKIGEENKVLPIRFSFSEKKAENQDVKFIFEQEGGDGKFYTFHEEIASYEVMKSDMNLTLIINGNRADHGIDFGEKLNYSLVYSNKGDAQKKDIVLMAVMNSDFLDWTTLVDENSGREKGNTISWTKDEIPELEVLGIDEEGVIDFSISVSSFSKIDPNKDYLIESYAQYSIGEIDETSGKKGENDNISNTIVSRINSDLSLVEEIRYFSKENIPVGTGPHPPKVGETTSYKVYWKIENSLHELKDLIVKVKLPENVYWDNRESKTVGDIKYIGSTHEVVWDIGRLPVTVFEATSEFNVSVNPEESDKNKIIVLLPGSTIKAVDSETSEEIESSTKAKTSRLEDDDIVQGEGLVE